MRVLLLALVLAACSFAAVCEAAHPITVEPPFAFSDEITQITIRGDVLSPESQVALFDGGGPREVDTIDVGGLDLGLDLLGSRLVVASHYGGLKLVDVSDPLEPGVVDQLELPGGARSLVVDGERIIVTNGEGWLHVVDGSDPDDPVLLGSVIAGTGLRDVAVENDHAFVVSSFSGLIVVDIAHPSSPEVVATLGVGGAPGRIDVDAGYAFVASCLGGLRIFDVREPSSPRFVAGVPAGFCTTDVVAADGSAFIGDDDGFLRRVDLTDPLRPRVLDSVWLGASLRLLAAHDSMIFALGHALEVVQVGKDGALRALGEAGRFFWVDGGGIAVLKGFAFVAGVDDDVRVFDVREPEFNHTPTLEAIPLEHTLEFDIESELLCVATRRGLEVFDLDDSDGAIPRIPVSLPGMALDVECRDGLAYVSDDWRGLHIFRVEDLARPRLVGRLTSPGTAGKLALDYPYAYLADGEEGLQIIDVSDPAAPETVGNVELPDWVRVVEVGNGLAYVAGGRSLHVARIAPPEEAALVATLEFARGVSAISVSTDFVYATLGGREGLVVIDVQDAEHPYVVARLPLPYGPAGLDVADGVAHVAAGSLLLIDVRDPRRPRLAGGVRTRGDLAALQLDQGQVFLGGSGVIAIRPNPLPEELGASTPAERSLEIPVGYAPGPYDVVARSAEGDETRGMRVFRVCQREALESALRPAAGLPPPPHVSQAGQRWFLDVRASERLLARDPQLTAHLALPDGASAAFVEFVDEPGPTLAVVEILEWRDAPSVVRLIGSDEERAREAWQAMLDSRGVALPERVDGSYGDIALSVRPHVPRVASTTAAGALFRGNVVRLFRFELVEGVLSAAGAWGREVDHVFRTDATYEWTCEISASVSFIETLLSICEDFAAEHPELVLDCDS